MKWIAHRGASLEMPENTLASLRLGSALGAYAVECDVRRLADGEYVIYHDGKRREDQCQSDAVCLPREKYQSECHADRGKENEAYKKDR